MSGLQLMSPVVRNVEVSEVEGHPRDVWAAAARGLAVSLPAPAAGGADAHTFPPAR